VLGSGTDKRRLRELGAVPGQAEQTTVRATLTRFAGDPNFRPAVVPADHRSARRAHIPARFGADAPSNLITMGFIGTGDHGTGWNLRRYLELKKMARVVVVCDVDGQRMRHAKEIVDEQYLNKDCAMTRDFREVLARKDVDAVMVSTPDHWHTLISVLALRAGKDVQCEKPTLTLDEGKLLIKEVRKHQKVFQTSTEDRSRRCITAWRNWFVMGGSASCRKSR
jgi:hypothetical protein